MELQVNLDMKRGCSFLIAFLFSIDLVARSEAIGVHNWSSILNNQPSKNWVILLAGSDTWTNYRHQANVYHAYQVVRANNVPPENIITFAVDDIANNRSNPFKGSVFHDYRHEDVYNGVVIDYRDKDVNPKMFEKVLKGDKTLERQGKKVLNSGRDDYVFIYYTGHGLPYEISFPSENLDAAEFNKLLIYLYSNYKYKKMVLYMDACRSGSIFQGMLPSEVGIYATTSAKDNEDSFAEFCEDSRISVCLATEFSYAWITDSQFKDIKTRTLDQQYEEVKRRTVSSHVMRYGEMAMKSLPVGKFQGHYDLPMHRNDKEIALSAADRKPSSRVYLFSMSRNLMEAITVEEHETAWRKLYRALQLGHIVKEMFRDIVMDVTTHYKPSVNELSNRNEISCFKAVFDHFRMHCFTIKQVPEVARQTAHLMELCKAGYDAETLIEAVHNICS
ncbi:hypothetical protein T265_10756 [Opisthorchis viverrini]|uniref:Hemoglobinase n=1 Tax=Opisthorchis viverrini TaxID=6198 RepID=A0A075A036_OPIVI|nr:hypothetical protein T265_10756 [Opisthorchis viverrini]KER20769.1 hypothetical protein T265_10756 [Opisthorchis viverrini]